MKLGLARPEHKRFRRLLDFVIIPPISRRRAKEYSRYDVEFVIDPVGDPRHVRRLAEFLDAKVLYTGRRVPGVETVEVAFVRASSVDPFRRPERVKNEYVAFAGPAALRMALYASLLLKGDPIVLVADHGGRHENSA